MKGRENVNHTVVVDIDNTLWDLAPVFFDRLKEVSPDIPSFAEWEKWRFWDRIVEPKTFYGILREIHLSQDTFEPFSQSRPFLEGLKALGSHIIIASHRDTAGLDAAARWFEKYGLLYDEFHFSNDKSILFDACCAVVDDSPPVLDQAQKAGLIRAGLAYPWNELSGHPVFNSLMEILEFLKKECREKSGR